MKKVYILLLVYKNYQDALDCLDSLIKSDYPFYHVVIADNSSPNDAYAILEKKLSEKGLACNTYVHQISKTDKLVSLIQTDYNGGFAFGNNFVIKNLLGEDAYIWLLNPDTLVTKQTLSSLVNCALSMTSPAVWGGVVFSMDNPAKLVMYGGGTYNSWGRVRSIKQLKDVHKLKYIHGACLFTHLSNFQTTGLIAEDYFLYWEETDWCYQFMANGGVLKLCEEAIVYDKIGGSVGRGYWQSYFMTYNKYRFYHKHLHQHLIKIILTIPYFFGIEILSKNPMRIKGFLNATFDFFVRRKMARIN